MKISLTKDEWLRLLDAAELTENGKRARLTNVEYLRRTNEQLNKIVALRSATAVEVIR